MSACVSVGGWVTGAALLSHWCAAGWARHNLPQTESHPSVCLAHGGGWKAKGSRRAALSLCQGFPQLLRKLIARRLQNLLVHAGLLEALHFGHGLALARVHALLSRC